MGRREREPELDLKLFKEIVPETDLREITRHSDRCLTIVRIFPNWDSANAYNWLTLGQARLRPQSDRNQDGRWRLEAYLPEGVTDFEHDSVYALKLPLIGVTFGGIEYQETSLTAWVDPNEPDDFHVPGPGYNPMTAEGAGPCEDEHCGEKHIMVPEGRYVPPFLAKLYKAVRGKRLTITIGVAYPEEKDGS